MNRASERAGTLLPPPGLLRAPSMRQSRDAMPTPDRLSIDVSGDHSATAGIGRLHLSKAIARDTMGGPLGPNVLITGTPGTGKTCTSQQIAVCVLFCGPSAVVGNTAVGLLL